MSENMINYNIIYVYSIDDEQHKGYLKIGKASLLTNKSPFQLPDNCSELSDRAKERIRSQLQTAVVPFELEYCSLARKQIKLPDGYTTEENFYDKDVHTLLYKAGYKAIKYNESDSEWFNCPLHIAVAAVKSVKMNSSELILDETIFLNRENLNAVKAHKQEEIALLNEEIANKTETLNQLKDTLSQLNNKIYSKRAARLYTEDIKIHHHPRADDIYSKFQNDSEEFLKNAISEKYPYFYLEIQDLSERLIADLSNSFLQKTLSNEFDITLYPSTLMSMYFIDDENDNNKLGNVIIEDAVENAKQGLISYLTRPCNIPESKVKRAIMLLSADTLFKNTQQYIKDNIKQAIKEELNFRNFKEGAQIKQLYDALTLSRELKFQIIHYFLLIEHLKANNQPSKRCEMYLRTIIDTNDIAKNFYELYTKFHNNTLPEQYSSLLNIDQESFIYCLVSGIDQKAILHSVKRYKAFYESMQRLNLYTVFNCCYKYQNKDIQYDIGVFNPQEPDVPMALINLSYDNGFKKHQDICFVSSEEIEFATVNDIPLINILTNNKEFIFQELNIKYCHNYKLPQLLFTYLKNGIL